MVEDSDWEMLNKLLFDYCDIVRRNTYWFLQKSYQSKSNVFNLQKCLLKTLKLFNKFQ